MLCQSSLERGESLYEYLAAGPGCVKDHFTCRRDYTNQKHISVVSADTSACAHDVRAKKLRPLCDSFNWITDCFYCGMPAIVQSHHPDRVGCSVASSLPFRSHILAIPDQRNDCWADQV